MTLERERLTLLVPTLGGGGAERVMVRLANALARRGVDVDLLVFTSEGLFKSAVAPEVELVDLGTVHARATLPALVRYLRRRRPATLLSTHDRANVLAVVARRLAGVPTRVVVRQASTFSEHVRDAFGRAAPFVPAVVRWAYLRADLVIAVSEGVGSDLTERLRLPEAHVTVVGNPVVTPELQRQKEIIPDEPWLSAGEPPVVLGVGRLVRAKDFATLLTAFARIADRTPARLLILGEGPERAALERLANDLGIAERVRMPGFTANPYAYMARAATFVLSSIREGLPGALIEAMACGCPVISTACPSGPEEILAGGRYGPLVPVGDAERMSEAMLRLLDEPPDRRKLREGAAPYALEAVAERYLELLLPATAATRAQAPHAG